MAEKKPVSFGKRLLFIGITLLFLFLLVEAILRLYYYQQYGNSKMATMEFGNTMKSWFRPKLTPYSPENQKKVRPDSSDAFNDLVTKETALSNQYEYQPWIEFKNIDYKGSHMNIENNVRKSIPDSYYSAGASDTLLIYFFGGSTTFGFNVADFETIPSYFVEAYKAKYPNAKAIKVVNWGCPNYYTYQELMLFTKLLIEDHKPDVAIFFDGLNDFWFGKMNYSSESFYSFYFRKSYFAKRPPSTSDKWFVDSLQSLFKTPVGMAEQQFSDQLITNYFSNIEKIKKMAVVGGTKTYFFCQPTPFYKYPNQQKDPMVFKDTDTRFNYIYPIIEKRADSISNFTFMGGMLQNESGYPFVDGFHYAPRIHRKIAAEMLTKVEKEFGN
ncbi:MAG: SGNH/GDSL hydrolase family protein [Chitinophagaceae bacterium]|nr:SGNH/GDSL hydrolase family protein [Chitinophagaceae bacterium]